MILLKYYSFLILWQIHTRKTMCTKINNDGAPRITIERVQHYNDNNVFKLSRDTSSTYNSYDQISFFEDEGRQLKFLNMNIAINCTR